MTVSIGDVTFSDWIGIEHEGRYTDTFIFHIDAMNGLPPFGYRLLLKRLVAKLHPRPGASLWIRVDAPGEWYAAEVKRSMLRGFPVPYVVTRADQTPDFLSFSSRPQVFRPAMKRPPEVDDEFSSVSPQALKCLQVLVRIRKGGAAEIASLSGLSEDVVVDVLRGLKENGLAEFKRGRRIRKDTSRPAEPDPHPLWHPRRKGLSITLRSWGASRRVSFGRAKEQQPDRICTPHRNLSRRWLAWLRAAYPRAVIWTGWSESRLPGMFVYPDALAWGRLQGYETLFWLEVGDEHKRSDEIEKITRIRLASALKFCRETGVRLVYAQISPNWVQELVCMALGPLPPEAAAVMASSRRFGKLPTVEWGLITMI